MVQSPSRLNIIFEVGRHPSSVCSTSCLWEHCLSPGHGSEICWAPSVWGDTIHLGRNSEATVRALGHSDFGKSLSGQSGVCSTRWGAVGGWKLDYPGPGLQAFCENSLSLGCARLRSSTDWHSWGTSCCQLALTLFIPPSAPVLRSRCPEKPAIQPEP